MTRMDRPGCSHFNRPWAGLGRWIAGALLTVAGLLASPAHPWAASEPGGQVPRATAPDGHEFRLEIASTPQERARGYMYRARVPEDEGMLFIFPQSDFYPFWMKNCLVSLDILWLSEDLTVVYMEEKTPPCRKDPCPSYPPMSKARYVLEIASGMARKTHLRVGEKVRLSNLDLLAVAPAP